MRNENAQNRICLVQIVALVTDGEKSRVGTFRRQPSLLHIKKENFADYGRHSIAFRDFKEGIITFDEIRTSPNQNKLLSSISDIDDLNFDVSKVIELKKGDAFVLCTDGFWEYVYEDDIEKSFAKTKSPKEWLEKMLESLHENEKENNDNYSAIAVEV